MEESNNCGAYVYRDVTESKLKLFIYSKTPESSTYKIIVFSDSKTYTAESTIDGIKRFIEDEGMQCLQTNTFEELQEKIPNFTKKDYDNMISVVNSKIDLFPCETQETQDKEKLS